MADRTMLHTNNPSVYIPLLPVRDASVKNGQDIIAVLVPQEDRCGSCGRHLLTLFDLDLRHPVLSFLTLQGQKLCIAMCPTCTLLGDPVYTDVDGNGLSRWSRDNREEPVDPLEDLDDWEDLPHIAGQQLLLGLPCSVLPDASLFGRSKCLSYIGNVPTWIQPPEYPSCPECGQKMLFVGQLALADVLTHIDGIIYAFLCSRCGKAANACQSS